MLKNVQKLQLVQASAASLLLGAGYGNCRASMLKELYQLSFGEHNSKCWYGPKWLRATVGLHPPILYSPRVKILFGSPALCAPSCRGEVGSNQRQLKTPSYQQQRTPPLKKKKDTNPGTNQKQT